MELQEAVLEFTGLVAALPDSALDQPWRWGDYDEGVRFAFFRVYEELRNLAAGLLVERQQAGKPPSQAQRILAQYHAAYLDLECQIFGIDEETAQRRPAEGEWPLRTILLHIIDAERSFLAINQYTVERERAADGRPQAMPDADWEAFWAGDPFPALAENGGFAELLAYYRPLHQRILETFVDVSATELNAQAVFWEDTPMPLKFRLHRFDSHLRQHTVQAEKTLAAIGAGPSEARRLLRLIFNALAEVQGNLLGAGMLAAPGPEQTAVAIAALTGDIRPLVQN